MTATRENANLYALLRSRFSAAADTLAIESPGGKRWNYAELDRRAGAYAAYLRSLGAAKGDRVAVQVDKSPEALALYLACVRAGIVYLPLNTAYPAAEVEFFLSDAAPRVVIAAPRALAELEPLARRHGVKALLGLGDDGSGSFVAGSEAYAGKIDAEPCEGDDIAAILYTSGTTGRPKGAMLSHSNLSSNALTLHRAWGFQPDDVLLHALPLFHTHGLFVACHCALLNASPMLLLPRFDVDAVIERLPRASVFMGVPTYYTRLLGSPSFTAETCKRMRLFVSGSAPLREQTFNEFKARTGHTILERYGMTECGMSTSNPLAGERKPGTVGPPLPGVSLRVVDDQGHALPQGEIGGIEFKGPNVFCGYWRQPDKTAEEFTSDGFFKSGDLGCIDEDGYVCIVGRDKDLVITGGFNVYPKEVELRIDALDGVSESAVIGVADADFGEAVTAVVVRSGDGEHPTERELLDQLKYELANYKVPKRVHFATELPRNAMGKVQKNLLRERYTTANGPD